MKDREERWDEGYRTVITCAKCEDEIHSRTHGEYVRCSCGNVAVDETPWYYRVVGDFANAVVESRLFKNLKKD